MPVYDTQYRKYEARAPLRSVRFWPITREGLRQVLSKRAFLGLLALSFLPFIARVIQIFITTRVPETTRVAPVDPQLFGSFLNGQLFFAVLLAIFGGAGLVANDLRTGAIVVYLSRPLTRRDYVLGKLGVTLLLGLAVTLVPALLLYLVALSLMPDTFALWRLAWIAPAIVVHSLVVSGTISLLGLALSALTRSARLAGLGLVSLILVLEIVRQVLQHGFGRREAALLSVRDDVHAIGRALFGIAEAHALPWPAPAAVLVALAGGCLAVLRRRVRAVEVVS
jgi:ABC-2 type transport system permease protein